MTTTAIHTVGFCASYSQQGDWAFDFALDLARRERRQLNIFHFLVDPYTVGSAPPARLTAAEQARLCIDREKELRFYYEERLGDYLEAGFRLCEDDEWTELHRCLCKRDFQVLVLGLPRYDATFGGKPLADFVNAFVCPAVVVGPTRKDEIYLNGPATMLADPLGLGAGRWKRIDTLRRVALAGVS